MATLGKEEEYFLRMLKLINGVAPKAIRDKFDQIFPPANLPSVLKRKEQKIRSLRCINSTQISKLFPVNGITASSEYDVTLMICLIRNYAQPMVKRPINNFDLLPPTTEKHDGADLARVEYYRNYLAHSEKDTLTSSEFTLMWATVTEAIIRLGGINYKDDCDRLINMNLNNDIIINLRQELQEIRVEMSKEIAQVKVIAERCSCHDFHEIEIEEWERKNQKYVTIDALDSVLKYIKEHKRVTVTGIPGVGKSALIQHAALSLRDREGYDIIPCKNPSEIQTHFKKDRLQVFVVNDVCGRYILNQYEIDEWKKYTSAILTILAKGSTILLFSCRSQIFKEKRFKTLQLFSHFCDLSSCKYKLSLDKKIEIAKQYLPGDSVARIKDELNNCEMVPLLCSLYQRYSDKDVSLFFTNPVEVYNDELKELDNESDKTKLCSLFFNLVYNGCISIEEIKSQSRQRVEEVFETFGVNRGTCTKTIIEKLESFTGTYLTKSGGEYKMIHDKLFDILCAYFGEHYLEDFIKFANSKVIYQRTWLKVSDKSQLAEDDSLTIFVDLCHENDYFLRILNDIENGSVIEVFYSRQMENVIFREKFINFMRTQNRFKIKSLLYLRDERGVDTPFHIVCALGYEDLLNFFLTFAENGNLFASDEFPPLQQACYYGHNNIVSLFILHGADLNNSGLNGLTPLIWACLGEQLAVVKVLLLNKVNIDLRVSGRSAVYEACSIQNSEILDTLIKFGANIYATGDNGETPIMRSAQNGLDRHVSILFSHYTDTQKHTIVLEACKKGCLPLLRFLIQHNFDLVDENGPTGLAYACEYGHLKIVKTLFEAMCNFNHFFNDDEPPLIAACRGRQRVISEYLIEKKVDVNSTSNDGWTALMETCEMGEVGLMKLLIENGASINQQDDYGRSPLMLVSERGNMSAVQLLITNGADVNQKDENGFSAFVLACDNKHIEAIKFLSDKVNISQVFDNFNGEIVLFRWLEPEYKKVVELLFKLGLDVNVLNNHGQTPLIEAILLINEHALKSLLDKGANPNETNKIGQTPLFAACIKKTYHLLPYLVEKGADIIFSDNSGNSILHMLCLNYKFSQDENMTVDSDLISNSHQQVLNFLDIFCIDKGLEINAKNNEGQTPLCIACINGNHTLARFLVENGTDVNISNNLEKDDKDNLSDSKGITPLMIACMNLHTELVDILVTHGADVNMTDNDGENAVYKLYSGQVFVNQTPQQILDGDKRKTIARKLLDSDLSETCKVESKNGLKEVMITKDMNVEHLLESFYCINAFLCRIIKDNQPSLITDLFLDDAIRSKILELDSSALCRMIRKGYDTLALYLIQNGEDINERDNTGLTPLIVSITQGKQVIVETLIKRGVDLNKTDSEGRTPLRWAAISSNLNFVSLLLTHGANINDRSRNGRTLLMWACRTANIHLIDKLYLNGADISLKDQRGINAIFWTLFYTCKTCHNIYMDLDGTEFNGADTNLQDKRKFNEMCRSLIFSRHPMHGYMHVNIDGIKFNGVFITLQDQRKTNEIYRSLMIFKRRLRFMNTNTDGSEVNVLSYLDTNLQRLELDFFNDQPSSVNDVIRECMRNRFTVYKSELLHILNRLYNSPHLAQAITLFSKKGGNYYLERWRDDEPSVWRDRLFHEIQHSEHVNPLLDYLYEAKENDIDNLPCTLDDFMELVKKKDNKHFW